jgi:hypothetical protein
VNTAVCRTRRCSRQVRAAPGARVLQIPLRPVPGERVAFDMLTLLATISGLVAAYVNEILPVLTQLLDA